MAGIFGRIVDALSVEEKVVIPKRRVKPVQGCANCTWWVSPDALTTKVLSSARAVAWAKDNGFGRCTATARGVDDKKRFTKAESGCDSWTPQSQAAKQAL